jgi:hypothetical protein
VYLCVGGARAQNITGIGLVSGTLGLTAEPIFFECKPQRPLALVENLTGLANRRSDRKATDVQRETADPGERDYVGKITDMDLSRAEDQNSVFITSCGGDLTIREGDWLRLWNSLGVGVAHDVWVGIGGTVYENSGPGGDVRRNTLGNVLAGRKVIHIVARTVAEELQTKVRFAESKLGTPWAGFYNCQDFASEVATGKPQSFQREAFVTVSVLVGGLVWFSNHQPPRKKRRARR